VASKRRERESAHETQTPAVTAQIAEMPPPLTAPIEVLEPVAVQPTEAEETLASMLGHYSAGFTLDTYTHVTHQMQQGAADMIGGFMEGATAITPEPEPPEPTRESGCRIIPFAQAM